MKVKDLVKNPDNLVVDSILKEVPVSLEIWFHGSRATGKHKKSSDVDILVIVPRSIVGDQYLSIVMRLKEIEKKFYKYDIQPSHPNEFIHQIAQEEGKLLWSHK
jgi:predicted nucleotidyltransferase